jgi:PAS domain S-box-containing protein
MPLLAFAVCENFEDEARAALAGLAASDVALAVFPARCGRPPLRQDELTKLVGGPCGGAAEVIGSVCCAALRRAPGLPDGWRVHALESCFELLAPKPMVEAQLRAGAYVLTSGWLRGWRERFAREGVHDPELARQIFGESTTRLVLLDTGVDPGARSRLDELSQHLALPAEVVPVGVELLRERLLRLGAEATAAAERKAHSAALAIAHQVSADYAAAFDVVGCLADSVDEREVVERTLDVCSMLFAPARLAYLSVGSGSDELEARPPLTDAVERRRLADDLARGSERPGGFTVSIEHGGQVLGVLGVEGVAFPHFRDRYLDLASTVARVCGMAVANARAFREVKLAKESLAMERERLAVTLNSIGDGVIATDCDGKVLLLNEVCARLTGFAQEEAVGRPLGEVFRVLDERTREPLVNPVEQVLRIGEAVDLINGALLVRRDGVEHHVADSAAPILDHVGRTLGVVLVFRDVTAQKRTRRLRRVLDEATQLLASSLDMPRVLGDVARLVAAELDLGCSIDVRDGVKLPKSEAQHAAGAALVAPIRSAEHEPFRGTVRLTSAAALDDEHITFARELARRVALALENAGLLETTRQAVLTRDRFLSVASHELRTPLTSLQLQGEAMSRRIARGEALSSEQVERLTSMLLRQVRRVRRLVDDMVDVSRMNAGNFELRHERVDLSALVDAELENRAEELRAGGYAVAVRTEPGTVGTWDPQRIEQVVANLVGNAIRYGQGKPLDVVVSREAAAATLLVRDRGPGVDPRDHERIFGAFERATSASEAAGGLGLGLYIVAQIVAAHGGSVTVESAPGAGATFVVQLPLERHDS